MTTFKDILKRICLARDITMFDVADEAGINRDTLASWIAGSVTPQKEKLANLIKTFELDDEEVYRALAETKIQYSKEM